MDLLNRPSFKSHVEGLLDKHHIPGLSVAVVHKDTFSSAGFGKAQLNSKTNSNSNPSVSTVSNAEQPCTADTLFDIASCSKSFTAAAAGLLVEDDDNFPQVQWDAKMSDLLPEDFVLERDEYTRDVTLEDCLSHRTGLASHDSSYLGLSSAHPDTPKSVTRNLRNLPLAKPVRSTYMYNNMLYTVVSHLIETLTGQTFAQFLQERIFDPLKMTSTYLQPAAARAAGNPDQMACGYRFGLPPPRPPNSPYLTIYSTAQEQEESYHPIPPPECPEAQGAGSILLSANDHITYLHALMHCHHPFSTSLVSDLQEPRFALPSSDPASCAAQPNTSTTLIGLGWEVIHYRGVKIVMHDGWINGFISTQFFLPDQKFAGVIRCNGDGGYAVVQAVCRELIDEVLGVELAQRTDWVAWFEDMVKEGEQERETKEDAIRRLMSEDGNGLGDAVADMDISASASRSNLSDDQQAPHSTKLNLSLEIFAGEYHNPGYHTFTAQLSPKHNEEGARSIFIDASDRSMGFIMVLEFICWATQDNQASHRQTEPQPQTRDSRTAKFLATLTDVDGCSTEYLEAKFVLENAEEGGVGKWKAASLGIRIEQDLEEMIWFQRVGE